jgi:hypothetical protein
MIAMAVKAYCMSLLDPSSKRSEELFLEAEALVKSVAPKDVLHSVAGYRYREFLMLKGDWTAARLQSQLSQQMLEDLGLLSAALDKLAFGRATLGVVLQALGRPTDFGAMPETAEIFTCLTDAVDRLRDAGNVQEIPRGLLTRAAFRRNIGDWEGALRDLEEVEEIAGLGPMRLYLCDLALERARLALARTEGFAPLSRTILVSQSKPPALRENETARLKEEASANVARAHQLIARCRYHRRDEEVRELEAVLSGTSRFADLPARV